MIVNSVPVLLNQLKGLQGMLLVIKFFVILQYKMKVKILYVFLPEEGNSHTHRASSSMTLMHTLVSGNEENQYKNSASTVIPEAGKAEHQIQLLASPLEDSNMQPDYLRTPARLTTPEGAQFKCSPSTPDPSLTYIEDNPRAGEYQGVIPKRN